MHIHEYIYLKACCYQSLSTGSEVTELLCGDQPEHPHLDSTAHTTSSRGFHVPAAWCKLSKLMAGREREIGNIHIIFGAKEMKPK